MNKVKIIWLLIVSAILLGVSAAYAQEPPVQFGVKGGLNLSNFGGDMEDTKAVFKYQFGVTADVAFTENIYLQTGLEFLTKGSKHKPETGTSIKYNPMYLQLPVRVAYKFEIMPGTKLFINAGPYVAYGIGGKIKGGDSKVDIFDDDRLKRFDYGIGGGVGVEFGKFTVSVGYDFGLANISDVKGTKVRNQNAFITLGYRF